MKTRLLTAATRIALAAMAILMLPSTAMSASDPPATSPAATGKRPEDLPRAFGWRRTRRSPRRRDQGAGGIPGADPLHRRHEHGRAGGRRLRHGHERAEMEADQRGHHRRTPVQGEAAARGPRDPAQARRLQELLRPGSRHRQGQHHADQGRGHRRAARDRAARAVPRAGLPAASTSCPSRSAPSPPTSSPARPWSSARAKWPT